MPDLCVSKENIGSEANDGPRLPPASDLQSPSTLSNLLRAEANFLRLPLFALGTKGLKTLDGIECRGRITRGGQTHQFVFRATRNTATLYPGPLARAAHLAFLSLLTEQGLPLHNPLSWTWRDLCRRMGIQAGGETVRHLKDAITSTALLGIQSEYALYAKPEGQLLTTKESALHLYERVVFLGSPLPEGGTADANLLWLSSWYLDNLNALFSAPLDYELWRFLDARSPIASRLYEFLLLNFYSGTPVLRINYETLAQFLPVHLERYRSSARRQLETPLALIAQVGVIGRVEWAASKEGVAQLHLYRGPKLDGPAASPSSLPTTEEFLETIAVKELRHVQPPEWNVVADFYRLWSGVAGHRPTEKELGQARDLIRNHGQAKTRALIPLVVKRLKAQWPDAKTFGALAIYLPEALTDFDRHERRKEETQAAVVQDQNEQEEQERKQAEEEISRQKWIRLPESDRAAIRQEVLRKNPRLVKFPALLERFSIATLAKPQTATPL